MLRFKIRKIALPLLLLALLFTVLFLLLPAIASNLILPHLVTTLPFSEKKVRLLSLTSRRLLGQGRLGDGLDIPLLAVTYSPRSLVSRQLDSIQLDSASIHLEEIDGSLRLRGLTNKDRSPAEGNWTDFVIPLAVNTVVIKNCSLIVNRAALPPIMLRTDGEFHLNYVKQESGGYRLSIIDGQLRTSGDLELVANLHGELPAGQLSGHLLMPELKHLLPIIPGGETMTLGGALNAAWKIQFTHQADISQFSVNGDMRHFRYAGNQIELVAPSAQKVDITLTGNGERADYRITNLAIAQPVQADITLTGEIDIPRATLGGTGTILMVQNSDPLQLSYQAEKSADGFDLSCQVDGHNTRFPGGLQLSELKATGGIIQTGRNTVARLDLALDSLHLPENDLSLHDITFSLPPAPLPTPRTPASAVLTIASVRHQKIDHGEVQIDLSIGQKTISFTTRIISRLFSQAPIHCQGDGELPSSLTLQCELPKQPVDVKKLQPLVKLPPDLDFDGSLAAEFEMILVKGIPEGKLTVAIDDGKLVQKDLTLEDIELNFELPHLPLLASSPSQLLTIGKLGLGKLQFTEGEVHFRLEDPQTLFIEKSSLLWAGGRVETGSLRLHPEIEDIVVTLYCDRLNFTRLLNQLGIEDTEGEGSLNGRLPVRISRQGIVFDDGFLFSTPGNSGIVRFHNTKQLRQGMADVTQSAYLDYSLEALENFAYNWTKLRFNSEDGELLIAMQLDGKPASPLAFGYRNGQIVPTSEGPGLQHPIRLDVNFRLPVTEMFRYGKNIQSIMEHM